MFSDAHSFSSFSVDNVSAAKKFYAETLGLDVEQSDDMGMPMLNITLHDGAEIMVYPKGNHEPATFTILNLKVDDVEKAVDELTAKGVAFEHYNEGPIATDEKGIARDPDGPGPDIAWFTDPAGNIIAVMQDK